MNAPLPHAATVALAPPLAATGFDYAMLASRLALAAALVVLAMVGIFGTTGIGQDPLQYVHSVADYQAILLKNPPVLRAAIGLDNLFIVLYSAMFAALGGALWPRRGTPRLLLALALGLLGLSGLLDLLENMHFLTMIAQALQGLEVGAGQITLQVWESLAKFHVSYLGLFVLGFALPADTMLLRALRHVFRWVQLPVGLLIYLVPAGLALPLVLVRFTFFVLALLALAAAFWRRPAGSSAPA
jgi:hypothetical protein